MYYILALSLHISKPFLCILNIFGSYSYIFEQILAIIFAQHLFFIKYAHFLMKCLFRKSKRLHFPSAFISHSRNISCQKLYKLI